MINTPYDDVFRTLLNDCRKLILPVLNEIFGENYSGEEEITFLVNEIFLTKKDGKQEKRITDSCFITRADNTIVKYHLECESNPDKTILVRIFEYDAQIALNDREQEGYRLKVNFPHTALIVLRAWSTLPKEMSIEISTPKGNLEYTVPVLKTQTYTVEEIFEKDLLFLLPFYIFSYEKQFKKFDADENKMIQMLEKFEYIKKMLGRRIGENKLDQYTAQTIIFAINKVVENLAEKHENVLKGVKDVMGGQILEYEAKDILRQGEARGEARGEQIFAQLTQILLKEKRYEDLERATDDVTYRKQLYKELKINLTRQAEEEVEKLA